jgi:TPP-dependent 2-oxoacid decarboxylase
MWNYSKLSEVFAGGDFVIGKKVTTEEELDEALKIAAAAKDKLVIIEAVLPNRDYSAGLQRLGNAYRGKK